METISACALYFGHANSDLGFRSHAKACFADLQICTARGDLEHSRVATQARYIILGSTLDIRLQCEILRSLNAIADSQCCYIVLTTDIDRQSALLLIASGADALLSLPTTVEALVEVFRRAELLRKKRLDTIEQEAAEDTANLPWLLGMVSQRLLEISDLVENNPLMFPAEDANNKTAQELLLAALKTDQPLSLSLLQRLVGTNH